MIIKQTPALPNRIFFALVVGVLVYFGLEIGAQVSLDERSTVIGYCAMLAGAIFATALPAVLIPDDMLSFHQLTNTPPEKLFDIQFRRWLPWMLSVMPAAICVAYFDPANFSASLLTKSLLLAGSLLTIVAIGIYSFCFYFTLGPTAQRWQEGSAGHFYGRLKKLNPALHPPLPRGLVPALTASARVFALSTLVVVAQLYLLRLNVVYSILPPIVAAAWAATKFVKLRKSFDRAYYPTNAFYREIFQSGGLHAAERDPIAYEAVYWTPKRWRSHAWMSLLQLDRVLPLGRFLTLGMLVIWILVWRNAATVYVFFFLGLFVVVKNLAVMRLSRRDLSPPAFQAWFQSPVQWGITFFFVNIRWTAPIFIGLAALAWIHPGFSMQSAVLWTVLDALLSFVFAFIITYGATLPGRERVHG